jgi:hypothetical protein
MHLYRDLLAWPARDVTALSPDIRPHARYINGAFGNRAGP